MQAPTTLLGVLWTVTTSLNKLAQLTLQRLCIMGLSDECLCQLFQTFTFTCTAPPGNVWKISGGAEHA